jgi:DMSO/TMAO reductase YedYZ molybdopterin-dependent catalytic subunit
MAIMQRPADPDTTVMHSAETRADLIVRRQEPFNAETPLAAQLGVITPTGLFYVRSNFSVPRISLDRWHLDVDGEVTRPLRLTYALLRTLPSRSLVVTLECAGNGRTAIEPAAEGEPWEYGAVATAEWTGVPLAAVLEQAGLSDRAREIVVEGADQGMVATRRTPISFARSLPVAKALDPHTLLAYAMNGQPLSARHGFPFRLVVPGWYGMASVKWVTRITASATPFDGYYQRERYVLLGAEPGGGDPTPVAEMGVRSLITWPAADVAVPRGRQRICGLAWSGAAPVARVEVSVDGGASWQAAAFCSDAARFAWRRWECAWDAHSAGPATLRSRAFDEAGNGQPERPTWNRLGYANNAVQVIAVQMQ